MISILTLKNSKKYIGAFLKYSLDKTIGSNLVQLALSECQSMCLTAIVTSPWGKKVHRAKRSRSNTDCPKKITCVSSYSIIPIVHTESNSKCFAVWMHPYPVTKRVYGMLKYESGINYNSAVMWLTQRTMEICLGWNWYLPYTKWAFRQLATKHSLNNKTKVQYLW